MAYIARIAAAEIRPPSKGGLFHFEPTFHVRQNASPASSRFGLREPMARRQAPHRRRPGAPWLADCWIGRSRIVWPAYRKFVWRSPRQVVWWRRFTWFMYRRWHLGSWVTWWLFRRRLRWIHGCRRLYLRRFDRRCGHFRYCCDRCRHVRMSHVAQRTAGLSVPAQLC
jgi:hypothetical protein